MSNRTAQAAQAIRKAWKREQQLVSEGKGTYEWSQEQQRSIHDIGIAYDDEGYAFQGHHMKSVETYPKYQGDPDIIQFLSKEDHLAAHKGWFRNPTNGYFNPETKEMEPFDEEGFVKCPIFDLKYPVYAQTGKSHDITEAASNDKSTDDSENKVTEETVDQKTVPIASNRASIPQKQSLIPITPMPLTKLSDEVKGIMAEAGNENSEVTDTEGEDKHPSNSMKPDAGKPPLEQIPKMSSKTPDATMVQEEQDEDYNDVLQDYLTTIQDYKIPDLPHYHYDNTPDKEDNRGLFQRIKDWNEDFPNKHPIATAFIKGGFRFGGQLFSQWAGYQMSAMEDEMERISQNRSSDNVAEQPSIFSQEDTAEPATTHSSPCEHEVGQHRQRYHTKHGVEWREKDPYKRGGNKDID